MIVIVKEKIQMKTIVEMKQRVFFLKFLMKNYTLRASLAFKKELCLERI